MKMCFTWNQQLVFLCCIVIINGKVSEKNLTSSLTTRSRAARYGYFDNLDNNLPYDPNVRNRFSSPPRHYFPFDNYQDPYGKPSNHEASSGTDQVEPGDKDDLGNYSYGPGGFYLPYNPKGKLGYTVKEVDSKDGGTQLNDESKDLVIKGMKVLTGNTEVETESKPNFLSVIRKFFKNPMVIVALTMIPLSFLLTLLFPYIIKTFGSSSLMPEVTSTIASRLARHLEDTGNLNIEQVLDTINEYGAKSMDDPRCFKRFACDLARSHVESGSGDFLMNVPTVLKKLAKAVDERVWEALSLNVLFSAVQNGNCDILTCKGSSAYTKDVPLIDKFLLLGNKFFSFTEVEQ